jgi:hypothetical protein
MQRMKLFPYPCSLFLQDNTEIKYYPLVCIKSWADTLANLLIEQGGFPGREMWPKRQPNKR